MQKRAFPVPKWETLPRTGCAGVEARVCLKDSRAVVATLRLSEHANIDIHTAPYDIHVLCIEGSGFVTCGEEVAELKSGESVLWPKDVEHNIYTENSRMQTIMLEHVYQLDDQ